MNVEITGFYKAHHIKEFKDKATGLPVQGDLVVQIEQEVSLPNNQIKFESYDVPLERENEKVFQGKKRGDVVKLLCNVYGENFAQIKIGKAK
jgi:hypothetical protein